MPTELKYSDTNDNAFVNHPVAIEIIAVTDFSPLKKLSNGEIVDTEYFELIKLRKIYFENVLKIAEKFDE
jgi:hypothetical protein